MRRLIRRAVLALAGAAGLIAVSAGAAAAGTSFNHTERLLALREGR